MNWAYLDASVPIAFAHRGGNTAAPENTMAAFGHAIGLGYRYIETDVHRTADGKLVAAHDSGLERVAQEGSARGSKISDLTWPELRAVDLGDGHGIPLFDEVLEAFPTTRFNVEPKADDAVDLLSQAIREHKAIDRVCVGSFDDRRISRMRRSLGPRLCTSAGPAAAARIYLGLRLGRRWTGGHGCLQIPSKLGPIGIDRRFVDGAHDVGLQIHVWTINEEAEMHELLDLGVDAIMTDNTELLRSVLIGRGQWTGHEAEEHGND